VEPVQHNELVAYTVGYEATRNWALWEQQGLWRTYRLPDKKLKPRKQDMIFWFAGLFLLVLAMVREAN